MMRHPGLVRAGETMRYPMPGTTGYAPTSTTGTGNATAKRSGVSAERDSSVEAGHRIGDGSPFELRMAQEPLSVLVAQIETGSDERYRNDAQN